MLEGEFAGEDVGVGRGGGGGEGDGGLGGKRGRGVAADDGGGGDAEFGVALADGEDVEVVAEGVAACGEVAGARGNFEVELEDGLAGFIAGAQAQRLPGRGGGGVVPVGGVVLDAVEGQRRGMKAET